MKQDKNIGPTLLWMCSVAGKTKLYICVLLIIQTILGISSVIYAMLLREIVNNAVMGDRNGFFTAIAVFTVLVVFQILLRAVNRFFEESTRSTVENRFKNRLFSTLLTGDYASVTKIHSGEWMNRLTSDTVVAADGMVQILPGVIGMSVKIAGALTAILWLEPKFLWILIPGGIILVYFSYAFRKILKKLHKKIQETDGCLRIFLSERLESLMIVKTFQQEKQTEEKVVDLMANHKAARMRRNYFSNICNIGFGAAVNSAYVLGAVFCGYGILAGTMGYGNFMAILQLISQIQNPFANITGYLPKYYAMLASAERLMEAEQFAKDVKDSAAMQDQKVFYTECFCGLEMKNVTFTYQPVVQSNSKFPVTPQVLSGMCLEIRKGEYVALTGLSGCGKSTVLKLLMCLYPLDSGYCYILTHMGKIPLTSSWRGLFAYVPQGNQLLSGTIREIVTFGDTDKMKHEDRIHWALTIACAEKFVMELENGLDTFLGEHGTGLSEGQMQRIAIARAVFSDHPILLLDEATSSLDEMTEIKLLDNLRMMTDKTVLLVTHRLAALKICDKQIDFGKNEVKKHE